MTKRYCEDCEHFGGRAIFQYDGRSKVMCFFHPLFYVYPNDRCCEFFEMHLPFYYRNDYLRKIIITIRWKLGREKIKL